MNPCSAGGGKAAWPELPVILSCIHPQAGNWGHSGRFRIIRLFQLSLFDRMARLPRLVIPNQLHYLIQKGNDGQPIFREEGDYAAFLAWLREAARQFRVAVHAYVLLPSQLHLLATPADAAGLGRMMQWTGRHYVPWFNRKYGRSGTLWQGRFKATVIEARHFFISCSQFIEFGPVREGVATDPAEYPWSSYAHHTGTRPDPLITDHPLYWNLGNTPFDREAAYKTLSEQPIAISQVKELEQATAKGWALGSEEFKRQMEKLTNRRVTPLKKGRPRKIPALE
jgi:putative transposase